MIISLFNMGGIARSGICPGAAGAADGDMQKYQGSTRVRKLVVGWEVLDTSP